MAQPATHTGAQPAAQPTAQPTAQPAAHTGGQPTTQAGGQPTPQTLALQTIRSVMSGEFNGAAWQKVEGFAHSKAREWRSAQLKRTGGGEAAAPAAALPAQHRRIVHVKRRKQQHT